MQPSYLTDQSHKKMNVTSFMCTGLSNQTFRSLKVWVSFHHYGKTKIGDWVDNNIDHAKHLHQLALADRNFESAAEPVMSAVCLHYKTPQLSEEEKQAISFSCDRKNRR
jgi:glutamate/tyrosine decarboxylase-like PLP-dependent enzyme